MKKIIIAMVGLAFVFASAPAYAQQEQGNTEHPRRSAAGQHPKNQKKRRQNAVTKTAGETHPNAANWAKNHPRRSEVNRRLSKNRHQISSAEKNGKLTKEQADQLNREDKGIRAEERADAAANGGHLTSAEQQHINKEESSVHQQLRADEQTPAAAPAKTQMVSATPPPVPAAPGQAGDVTSAIPATTPSDTPPATPTGGEK